MAEQEMGGIDRPKKANETKVHKFSFYKCQLETRHVLQSEVRLDLLSADFTLK